MPEVHLTGTIRSGSDFGVPAAYVRWRVDAGPGWTLLDGSAAGHSHTAEADTVSEREGGKQARRHFAAR